MVTPEKLTETAIDLFAANGFARTSTRDIAQGTRMTISNIYNNFDGKEGLLFAILERATQQTMVKLREVVESDLELPERFKLLLRTHLRRISFCTASSARLDENDSREGPVLAGRPRLWAC